MAHKWVDCLCHPYCQRGRQRFTAGTKSVVGHKWADCLRSPTVKGVPNSLERGTKTGEAHKSADWLGNPVVWGLPIQEVAENRRSCKITYSAHPTLPKQALLIGELAKIFWFQTYNTQKICNLHSRKGRGLNSLTIRLPTPSLPKLPPHVYGGSHVCGSVCSNLTTSSDFDPGPRYTSCTLDTTVSWYAQHSHACIPCIIHSMIQRTSKMQNQSPRILPSEFTKKKLQRGL